MSSLTKHIKGNQFSGSLDEIEQSLTHPYQADKILKELRQHAYCHRHSVDPSIGENYKNLTIGNILTGSLNGEEACESLATPDTPYFTKEQARQGLAISLKAYQKALEQTNAVRDSLTSEEYAYAVRQIKDDFYQTAIDLNIDHTLEFSKRITSAMQPWMESEFFNQENVEWFNAPPSTAITVQERRTADEAHAKKKLQHLSKAMRAFWKHIDPDEKLFELSGRKHADIKDIDEYHLYPLVFHGPDRKFGVNTSTAHFNYDTYEVNFCRNYIRVEEIEKPEDIERMLKHARVTHGPSMFNGDAQFYKLKSPFDILESAQNTLAHELTHFVEKLVYNASQKDPKFVEERFGVTAQDRIFFQAMQRVYTSSPDESTPGYAYHENSKELLAKQTEFFVQTHNAKMPSANAKLSLATN